ncbi:Cornichon [Cinara cedri]|uniref:Cornichon n=1 Tax=Cinara cedri TaxID=506608 RepID=A0A5E4M3L8_9HEMI|nr:Cornichon [Cinara cedri]
MWEIITYGFAMIMTGALLFLMIYSIITLSDLECDYLNAQECCSRLNFWVQPKIFAQTLIFIVFLTDFNWLMSLMNLPAVVWVIYETIKVPKGNTGLFDPAEIHHRGQLKNHMRNAILYTAWYLVSFFFYLYFMILAILKGNPLETEAPQHVNKF